MYDITFYDVIHDFGEGSSKFFLQKSKSSEYETKKFFCEANFGHTKLILDSNYSNIYVIS